jgi:hypothetical protein
VKSCPPSCSSDESRQRRTPSVVAQVFVVDQNYFRSEELKALASGPGSKFVILDEALIEMCKAPEWENTLRGSLRTLASRPAKVVVGKSMSELLRWELEHKRSVAGHLLDAQGTLFLQDILEGIRLGASSSKLAVMRENIEVAQREMEKIHLDHDDNKRRLVELVSMTASTQPELAAALRKSSLSREDRLRIIKAQGVQAARAFFEKGGVRPLEAQRMIRQRSLSLRFGLVRLWYAFDWLERQRIEGIAAPKATNEKMDYRYLVPGTFFSGGLLTREVQMNRCFADIVELLRRWDTF